MDKSSSFINSLVDLLEMQKSNGKFICTKYEYSPEFIDSLLDLLKAQQADNTDDERT